MTLTKHICAFPVQEIHNGYFSIDKKSGHAIDSKTVEKVTSRTTSPPTT